MRSNRKTECGQIVQSGKNDLCIFIKTEFDLNTIFIFDKPQMHLWPVIQSTCNWFIDRLNHLTIHYNQTVESNSDLLAIIAIF